MLKFKKKMQDIIFSKKTQLIINKMKFNAKNRIKNTLNYHFFFFSVWYKNPKNAIFILIL